MKRIKSILAMSMAAVVLCTALPIAGIAAPKASKLKLSGKSLTMEVGEKKTIKSKGTADIKATISPKTASKSIKVSSDDKEVVKIKKNNNFSYTATAMDEGTATLTVTSLSNKKLKTKLQVTVNAKEEQVQALQMTARQTAENKITAAFNKELTGSLSLSSFKLTDKTGNSVVALEKLKLSEEKKQVELTAYISLNNGSKYELSYTDKTDGKTYTSELTAAKGEVAEIRLLTGSIPVNVTRTVQFAIYDDKGVDVTRTYKSFVTITADIESGAGFFNTTNNELRMYKTGATAKFKMIYQNGDKKLEGSGIISTISETDATVSVSDWSFWQGAAPIDWLKADRAATKSIAMDTGNMKFFVKLKTSNGTEIKSESDSGVKLSSTNPEIFTITGNSIVPVSKGTADIIVEYTYEGKTSKFTPARVSIGDNAKPMAILLSENSVYVSSIGSDNSLKVKAVKDQYGNDFSGSGSWSFICSQSGTVPTASESAGTITVTGNNANVGSTYDFRVEFTAAGSTASMVFGVIVKP